MNMLHECYSLAILYDSSTQISYIISKW